MRLRATFLLLALTLAVGSASAAVYYVDANNGSPTDGTTWANAVNAFGDLPPAALGNDNEVWVKSGEYTNPAAIAADDVDAYGGFPTGVANPTFGQRDPDANPTTVTVATGSVAIIGDDVIVDGFILTGGAATEGGGVYFDNPADDSLLSNCVITGNDATDKGGGVYVAPDSGGTIQDCVIERNTVSKAWTGNNGDANIYGGAGLHVDSDSTVSVLDSIIRDNAGPGFGGAGVMVTDRTGGNPTTPLFDNVTISGNTTGMPNYHGHGGAGVHITRAAGSVEAEFTSCAIVGNYTSTARGGGMYCYTANGATQFTDCLFLQNTGKASGGGVYITGSVGTTFTGCAFSENFCDGAPGANVGGGGFRMGGGDGIRVIDCAITGNTCFDYGGGVHLYTGAALFEDCVISGNTSPYGGGICTYQGAGAQFTDCTIENNTATDGGGIQVYGQSVDHNPQFTGCVIRGNTATSEGGGVYVRDRLPSFSDCDFVENVSDADGGGAYVYLGEPTFDLCRFIGNEAVDNGGGLCSNNGAAAIANSVFAGNRQTLFTDHNYTFGGGGLAFINSAHTATVTSCVVSGNIGDNLSGGVFSANNASPAISQCYISGNTKTSFHSAASQDGGGGVYITSSLSTPPSIENCVITGNECMKRGAGVMLFNGNPVIANCVFARNRQTNTGRQGAAVTAHSNSDPRLVNCIIADHDYTPDAVWEYGADADIEIFNCLFFNNGRLGATDQHVYDDDQVATLNTAAQINSMVPAGSSSGNLANEDPLFPAAVTGQWTADASYSTVTLRTTYTAAPGTFEDGALVGLLVRPTDAGNSYIEFPVAANTDATVEVWGDMTGFGGDTGEDYSIYDFTILSNSPAVDAGRAADAASDDFFGAPRPATTDLDGGTPGYEIGAVELVPDSAWGPASAVRQWKRY